MGREQSGCQTVQGVWVVHAVEDGNGIIIEVTSSVSERVDRSRKRSQRGGANRDGTLRSARP